MKVYKHTQISRLVDNQNDLMRTSWKESSTNRKELTGFTINMDLHVSKLKRFQAVASRPVYPG